MHVGLVPDPPTLTPEIEKLVISLLTNQDVSVELADILTHPAGSPNPDACLIRLPSALADDPKPSTL
jgi:hypothetical protein